MPAGEITQDVWTASGNSRECRDLYLSLKMCLVFGFFLFNVYVCVLHLVWLNWNVTCEPEKEIVQNKEQRLIYLALENFSGQFGLFFCLYSKCFHFELSKWKEAIIRSQHAVFLLDFEHYSVYLYFLCVCIFFVCLCHLKWLKWKGERRSCASYLSAVKNWRSRGRETKREEKTGILGGTTGIYKYHAVAEYALYQLRDQFNARFYRPSPKRSKTINQPTFITRGEERGALLYVYLSW